MERGFLRGSLDNLEKVLPSYVHKNIDISFITFGDDDSKNTNEQFFQKKYIITFFIIMITITKCYMHEMTLFLDYLEL